MTPEIHVGNSYSQVKHLPVPAYRKLRRALSFVKTSYFTQGFPQRVHLLDSHGVFPSGLLSRVKNELTKQKVEFATKDNRAKPCNYINFNLSSASVAPYPDQTAAADAAVRSGKGIISMPTGTGKSRVIALLIARLRLRTLVVVPTVELKTQLSAGLLRAFNDPTNIVVENVDSPNLAKLKNFDVLIIDEAHHAASKTYQKLNKTAWVGIYHRFFLTATPWRTNRDEKLILEGIAGRIIFELPYREAVSKGYIVPVDAYYVDLPKTPCRGVTYDEVYNQLIVNNEVRNDIIANVFRRLDKPTLCLVREIRHGENLQTRIGVPFVNGQDTASRRHIADFNDKIIPKLIGTTGVLGEGIDTKPCEYVIIACLGKAKSAFLQQVGRSVRTYPGKKSAKVILFRDKSHRFTLQHFNEQVTIMKEYYGVTPLKLEIG